MSSCLLPPFNCQPDSSSVRFRSSYHLLRNKEPVCFLTKCVASTASILTPTTSALDVDRLMLPSFESTSGSFISDRQWTYRGLVGPPTQAKLESVLASETLLTSHEAVIAAASAETVALAKAAVKLARDTALIYNIPTAKADNFCSVSSTSDKPVSKWGQFTEKELAGIIGDSIGDSAVNSINVLPGDLELDNEEIELLEEEACECIAVRSNKQTERRRKRARATEKVSSTVMPVKSGSSGRRKRPSVQEVNHSDLLRYLRGTASNSKLLTVKDEVELSEGIQVLLKLEMLQKELAEKCGGPPTFAQWAAAAGVDQKTLRKRINHGVLCKDKMIRCNIRLVISIAKNYQGAGMNLQDLVQEGCRGLVRGAEKFDASKGFKFATYAHWWIKQAVRKFLSDQSRTIRLPFHMVEATFRVKEARKKLYSEIGRQPNDEEVAAATGLSMKRLRTVLLIPKAPRSLDEKFGINLDLKPSEVIADPRADTPEEILLKQIMRQDLEKALDNLRPREKQVIKWRFGVEAGRVKTLQEIGELIGVSRERVRQIETSAFRKLTNKKRSKHLQQYLVALH